MDQYREAVVGRFAEGSPVRVQLRNHKGQTVVDFRGIPVMEVAKLAEALVDQLYPAGEAQQVEEARQTS